MTKQIDDLMALADRYATQRQHAHYRHEIEARQELRAAIEAALKPDPSCDDVKLAELIMSDCGHSTNNTHLLERITNRIAMHTAPQHNPDVKPVEPETVIVFGVKPNGEVVDTGFKAPTPPRMKAKELVNEMYGRTWEEDDGSEADLCFAVCEQFFDWLLAKGWTAAPPVNHDVKPFGWVKSSEVEQSKRFGGSVNLWREKFDCDVPLFAAPPAQTPPPRTTDAELKELAESDEFLLYVDQDEFNEIARAIESAVRKQFGVNDE